MSSWIVKQFKKDTDRTIDHLIWDKDELWNYMKWLERKLDAALDEFVGYVGYENCNKENILESLKIDKELIK